MGDDTMGGHNASLSKHLRVGYVAHGTMAKEYDDKCAVAKHAHDEDEREENDDEIRLGAIHWTHVVLLLGGIVHGCDGCCRSRQLRQVADLAAIQAAHSDRGRGGGGGGSD